MILMKLGDEYKLYSHDSCIATTQESPHKRLSKQNCDTIFGATDVNELANQNAKKDLFNGGYDGLINAHQQMLIEVSYINGFKKAMELNKDKLFTVEDMKKAIEIAKNSMCVDNDGEYCYSTKANNEIIQSLQQPTEIEIEIEMENYGYCEGCRKAGMWHCAHADTCGYAETRERPKLDANDCLILKKK